MAGKLVTDYIQSETGTLYVQNNTGGTIFSANTNGMYTSTGSQVISASGNIVANTANASILNVTNKINMPNWTTSTRPSNPSSGTAGFNSTLGYQENYNGTNWSSVGRGVIQVVHFPMPYSWSGTSVSEGNGHFIDSPLTASITLQNPLNSVLITTNIYLGHTTSNGGYQQHFRIKKVVNGVTTYPVIGNNESNRPRVSGALNMYNLSTYAINMLSGVHIDSPGTTSTISYVIQVGGYSGSTIMYINRSEGFQSSTDYDSIPVSTLTLMEIAP